MHGARDCEQAYPMNKNFLVVDPEEDFSVLHGLASPVRIRILKTLLADGGLNVNDIAARLGLPQSTISSNVQILGDAGLIRTESHKAKKGSQKICFANFDEVLVMFKDELAASGKGDIEVAMPLGLYTSYEVSAPCGMCSPTGIVGLLDVPDTFLNPDRMKAALLWFTRGYVEYQFPNNAKLGRGDIEAVEFSLELSSEVPGTSADWPSDVTFWVNGVEIGTWTSPGDFGDKRGVYTPGWWKLEGSQYGKLKTWRVARDGTWLDGMRLSDCSIDDLKLNDHHSIRLRIGIRDGAEHPGGINIFGRGFGNYDQDIVLRIHTSR